MFNFLRQTPPDEFNRNTSNLIKKGPLDKTGPFCFREMMKTNTRFGDYSYGRLALATETTDCPNCSLRR